MKILYALDSYRPNIDGVGISIERQALGLASRGHEVAILAPGQSFADYEENIDSIRVFRIRSIKLILNRWRLALLAEKPTENLIEKLAPDVVVVSLPFPLNIAALHVSRRKAIPVVGITGTMPEWLIYNIGFLKPFAKAVRNSLWRYISAFYNQCERVVAVTTTAMNLLQENGLDRPVQVISNGVNLRQFRPRPRDEALARYLSVPQKPTVLYTGRLDSEKRMDVWIRAIPTVLQEMDVHFIIVGDGSERERLMEMTGHMGIGEHVTFTGFLTPCEYCAVFSLADIFAIASPAELQSIVTLEAAASGLPIVAANAGALPELVREGQNGYLFEPENSVDLAEKLLTILQEPERAQLMRQESRAIAQQHDLEVSITKYEDLYRGLVESESLRDPGDGRLRAAS